MIGTGRPGGWASGTATHAGAYRACTHTVLVGVCDSDPARAADGARRWGVAAYSDPRRLLAEARPEIVSICTPDETHGPILRLLLRDPMVRAILAEKPLALTVPEAASAVRLARVAGVKLAVNYSRRYSPEHAELQRLIAAGRLGPIQKIQGLYTKGVLHNGTHWFDLARWLVGDFSSVRGIGPTRLSDPEIDVLIDFRNGAKGCLQCCAASAFGVFEMDVIGTHGRARITESGHKIEFQRPRPSPRYRGFRALAPWKTVRPPLKSTLRLAVADLARSLRRGCQPACTGEDGLAALRAATAAIRSARQRRAPRP
ncbi:MAG TPA: Gfo/Idh/MocA family oxidoreductase [Opitutaceae bacterium]|nr:Gfo/Idh/MocA family oxidoreductase [Opitutaceae bacterium]